MLFEIICSIILMLLSIPIVFFSAGMAIIGILSLLLDYYDFVDFLDSLEDK